MSCFICMLFIVQQKLSCLHTMAVLFFCFSRCVTGFFAQETNPLNDYHRCRWAWHDEKRDTGWELRSVLGWKALKMIDRRILETPFGTWNGGTRQDIVYSIKVIALMDNGREKKDVVRNAFIYSRSCVSESLWPVLDLQCLLPSMQLVNKRKDTRFIRS